MNCDKYWFLHIFSRSIENEKLQFGDRTAEREYAVAYVMMPFFSGERGDPW
jgi:hypothetical protein